MYQSLLCKLIFTQMNANKGIKIFGEKDISDMSEEYKQLDDGTMPVKPVVATFNSGCLTPLDINKTLEAVNLIKDKCCGKIKART